MPFVSTYLCSFQTWLHSTRPTGMIRWIWPIFNHYAGILDWWWSMNRWPLTGSARVSPLIPSQIVVGAAPHVGFTFQSIFQFMDIGPNELHSAHFVCICTSVCTSIDYGANQGPMVSMHFWCKLIQLSSKPCELSLWEFWFGRVAEDISNCTA